MRGLALGLPPFAARPVGRIALVGETFADVREVMIEDVSWHASFERPTWLPTRRRTRAATWWRRCRAKWTPACRCARCGRRGKWLRAEPVAAVYAQGRVRHVGALPELEDEMCDFGTDGLSAGRSADRLDALVWALTALMLDEAGESRVQRM